MGGHATAEERRIYVDQIDEAMQRAQRDGGRKLGARAPRRQLADLALRRLKDSEKLSKAQRKLLKTHAGDLEFTRAFNATTKTITNLIDAVRRGHEAEREAFSGLTEEQLDAVFRSQIPRIAPTLDESERRTVLEIWFGQEIADLLLKPREVLPEPTAPLFQSHVISCARATGTDEQRCTCPSSSDTYCCLECGRRSVRYLEADDNGRRMWWCDHCGEQGGIQPNSRRVGGHIAGCPAMQVVPGACTCPTEAP